MQSYFDKLLNSQLLWQDRLTSLGVSQSLVSIQIASSVNVQAHSSLVPGIIGLICTITLASGILLAASYQRYKRYRLRRQIQSLERLWQRPYRKPLH